MNARLYRTCSDKTTIFTTYSCSRNCSMLELDNTQFLLCPVERGLVGSLYPLGWKQSTWFQVPSKFVVSHLSVHQSKLFYSLGNIFDFLGVWVFEAWKSDKQLPSYKALQIGNILHFPSYLACGLVKNECLFSSCKVRCVFFIPGLTLMGKMWYEISSQNKKWKISRRGEGNPVTTTIWENLVRK